MQRLCPCMCFQISDVPAAGNEDKKEERAAQSTAANKLPDSDSGYASMAAVSHRIVNERCMSLKEISPCRQDIAHPESLRTNYLL